MAHQLTFHSSPPTPPTVPQDQPGQWQALVGATAPAFQAIQAAVPPGPWKPFKEQACWLLLLLAAKAPANRCDPPRYP
jgi:hypothetical protein